VKVLKVIVVDDELGIREGIRRVLSKLRIEIPGFEDLVSFEVSVFETGESGVEALKTDRYDICLLDNKLPGISGTDVLEFIGKECVHKPLTVMITAFPSVETADIAMTYGAFDFLGKPFKPDELKAVLIKASEKLLKT
jgi:DNA-binding NtrC family response regulator